MANIRGNYFRPAATCGIGALPGRPRIAGASRPERAIRDFSITGPVPAATSERGKPVPVGGTGLTPPRDGKIR